MTKFYFWGIHGDSDDGEEIWEVLHKHFKRLAGEDDDAPEEEVVVGKGAERK